MVLTNVRMKCKVSSRSPRKTSGGRVCKVRWRRITLVIELHWRVVETNRRRTASSGSPRVSQISRWSWVRGKKLSRLGLGRISWGEVGGSMVGRWCSLGDLCLWVLWRLFCFTVLVAATG